MESYFWRYQCEPNICSPYSSTLASTNSWCKYLSLCMSNASLCSAASPFFICIYIYAIWCHTSYLQWVSQSVVEKMVEKKTKQAKLQAFKLQKEKGWRRNFGWPKRSPGKPSGRGSRAYPRLFSAEVKDCWPWLGTLLGSGRNTLRIAMCFCVCSCVQHLFIVLRVMHYLGYVLHCHVWLDCSSV